MYCLKAPYEKTDSMFRLSVCLTVLAVLTIEGAAPAQFESVRRQYGSAEKNDPVAKLQKQIESGKVGLGWVVYRFFVAFVALTPLRPGLSWSRPVGAKNHFHKHKTWKNLNSVQPRIFNWPASSSR